MTESVSDNSAKFPTTDARLTLPRMGLACLSVAGATTLRLLLTPALGLRAPLLTFYLAILISAWIGGIWTGVLSVVLSTLAAAWFFFPHPDSLQLTHGGDMIVLVLFSALGILICMACETQRVSRQQALEHAKKAEENAEALRASEERYSTTLSSIGDAVIATDHQGRITLMNPIAEKLTGWKLGDAEGKLFEEVFIIVDEETGETIENPVRRVLETGDIVDLSTNTLLVSKDGAYYPIDDSGAPIRDRKGQVVGVVLVFHDITSRRTAELSVAESERRFRRLADSAPVLIWISGTDSLCNYFNKPWLEFTGRTMDQELGNGWTQCIHPDDRDDCLQIYLSHFEQREPFMMEFRYRNFRGEYRWLLDNGVPLFNDNGEFRGYIGSCVDIHDRRLAEIALQETEARMMRFMDANVVGILFGNTDGRIHQANDAFLQLIGRSRADLIAGKLTNQLVTPSEWQEIDEKHIHEAVARGVCSPYEKEYLRPDGQRVQAMIGYVLVGKDRKETVSFVMDVTEDRRRQHQIEQLNSQLQWAIRETHHRVKNNLQIIASMADSPLEEGAKLVPAERLRQISINVRTLSALHDILTRQVTDGADQGSVSSEEVLEKLITLIEQANGVSIVRKLTDVKLTLAQGTSLALLTNELVLNALKYGRGSIEVTLEQNKDMMCLEVCDDGPGFSPDFDAFRFASIGLELVTTLARHDLHGSVQFKNRRDGGGQVIVDFPFLIPNVSRTAVQSAESTRSMLVR